MKPVYTKFLGDIERAKSLLPTASKFLRMLQDRYVNTNLSVRQWVRKMDDNSIIRVYDYPDLVVLSIESPFVEGGEEGKWSFWLGHQDTAGDGDFWTFHMYTLPLPQQDTGFTAGFSQTNNVQGDYIVDTSSIAGYSYFPNEPGNTLYFLNAWPLNGNDAILYRSQYYDNPTGTWESWAEVWNAGIAKRINSEICYNDTITERAGGCYQPFIQLPGDTYPFHWQPKRNVTYMFDRYQMEEIDAYLNAVENGWTEHYPLGFLSYFDASSYSGTRDPALVLIKGLADDDTYLTTDAQLCPDGWLRYAFFNSVSDVNDHHDFNVELRRLDINDVGRAIDDPDLTYTDQQLGYFTSGGYVDPWIDGNLYFIDRIGFFTDPEVRLRAFSLSRFRRFGFWFYLSGFNGQSDEAIANETYEYVISIDESDIPEDGYYDMAGIYIHSNTEFYASIGVHNDAHNRWYLYVYKFTQDDQGSWSKQLIQSHTGGAHPDNSYDRKLHVHQMGRYLYYRFYDAPRSADPLDWYDETYIYDMVDDYLWDINSNFIAPNGSKIYNDAANDRLVDRLIGGFYRPKTE